MRAASPPAPRTSCLKCGATNPANQPRCKRCGARLPAAKAANKPAKKAIRLARAEPASIPRAPSTTSPIPAGLALDAIHCGDAAEVMARLPAECVDLVVTSPPYNFGLDQYDAHHDTQAWADYTARLEAVFRECARLLKVGGRICVVVQPLFSDYMPTHHVVSDLLRRLGLLFKAEILWEKHNYNCKYTAWGSWCSPSMPYLKYTWEYIEVFCKGTQKKPGRRERSDLMPEEFKKWVYARWEVAPESRMREFEHPSMFPEEIPRRLIKLFSYVGDVVLDPFNGVGTSTLVARQLGRRYIGIDISAAYCKKAEERLQQLERTARQRT